MAFLGGFSSCSEASSELLSVLWFSSNRLALCSHQYGANNTRTIAVKHLASHGSQGLGLLGGTWCCSEPRELVRAEPLCSPAIPWGWGAWWWLLGGTSATSADTGGTSPEVLVPLGQQSPPWGPFLTFLIQPGPPLLLLGKKTSSTAPGLHLSELQRRVRLISEGAGDGGWQQQWG